MVNQVARDLLLKFIGVDFCRQVMQCQSVACVSRQTPLYWSQRPTTPTSRYMMCKSSPMIHMFLCQVGIICCFYQLPKDTSVWPCASSCLHVRCQCMQFLDEVALYYRIYSRISRPLKIESVYGRKSLTRV